MLRNSNLEYLIIWLSTIWLYPICQEIPTRFPRPLIQFSDYFVILDSVALVEN